MPQTTEELILDKADKILKILAVIATKGLKQREQIAFLEQAGLQPKDIAALLGTTANTVRVALVGLRKSKVGEKGRRKRQDTTGK